MRTRGVRRAMFAPVIAVSLVVVAACAAGAPTATSGPSVTAAPMATSYAEFGDAYCSAWDALIRAVGNPDTGSGSELSHAMDNAISAGDGASVDRLAAATVDELESGRRYIAIAAGWQPAAPMMAEMDRLFVAFQALIEAKRAGADKGLGEARRLGQDALIQAGGGDAWTALIRPGPLDETRRAIQSSRPAGEGHRCPTVPYVSTP